MTDGEILMQKSPARRPYPFATGGKKKYVLNVPKKTEDWQYWVPATDTITEPKDSHAREHQEA